MLNHKHIIDNFPTDDVGLFFLMYVCYLILNRGTELTESIRIHTGNDADDNFDTIYELTERGLVRLEFMDNCGYYTLYLTDSGVKHVNAWYTLMEL